MSHYLSTFLYEPIARQARRFSSPHITEPGDDLTFHYGSGTDRRLGVHEEEDTSALDIDDHHEMSTISDQPIVLSPTSEDGGLEEELQALRHNEPGSSPFDRGSSASSEQTVDASRFATTSLEIHHRDDPETISNHLRGTTARFRSANTSISSSINDTGLTRSGSPSSSRRSTLQDAVVSGMQSYMSDGVLPEDDGMRVMRKKITEIQSQDISTAEKSRLMHELMIQPYTLHHPGLMLPNYPRNRSPGSFRSQDRPYTPSSGLSISDTMNSSPPQTSVSSVGDQDKIYQVTLEDLTPTYWVPPITPTGSLITSYPTTRESAEGLTVQDAQDDQDRDLGCAHYKRNVKLQCSACYRWYTCRFCHDEVEDHSLNRRETKNMLCMLCCCPQPAAEECKDCGVPGARYYCGVCKLWDDDPRKSIYHCNDCGICRVGQGLGKDFYHCKVSYHHVSSFFTPC